MTSESASNMIVSNESASDMNLRECLIFESPVSESTTMSLVGMGMVGTQPAIPLALVVLIVFPQLDMLVGHLLLVCSSLDVVLSLVVLCW